MIQFYSNNEIIFKMCNIDYFKERVKIIYFCYFCYFCFANDISRSLFASRTILIGIKNEIILAMESIDKLTYDFLT